MNQLDTNILGMLIKDGRMSFAEIARELRVSRAHVRERVQQLMEQGVIEQFTAVINPEKIGKAVSAFLDIRAAPESIETVARSLSGRNEVVSLYIMSDMQSLHVHTLTDSQEALHALVREQLFGRPGVLQVECKTLMARPKHRRGGPRL
ncbi:MAG: Lrp/AsnC family transcriptional regulator [Ectothiorhodospiraceae bacterium]|nr:Lrp/AsnC family transcriptional regulator [Ectothiorhodospiraceae bacterium]MCH8503201.1 Lrp/AsnC family transcriptional regulator [Ectothiorhodospiraceae bacterium]